MGISDRLLGKKNVNGKPHIESIVPSASLPGGEVRIAGTGLKPPELNRPQVRFGDSLGSIIVSADDLLIAKVPEGAVSGPVMVTMAGAKSNPHEFTIATPLAENLHPVSNPAVDAQGNIYATFSGPRGQKVPVAIFRIDPSGNVKPVLADIMNATAIAFDRDGRMFVSSRYDGAVYRIGQNGIVTTYAEGMGIATGLAFDSVGNLYVGDRSGTIFKIGRDRQTFVFATLEASVSAYHLAFGPDGNLYVTGPTTSSCDVIYSVDPHGDTTIFYRGLGRPQGLAFDISGNIYVTASLAGRRGVVKITPSREASLAVSGHGLVGLAFAPNQSLILATTNAIHQLPFAVQGKTLAD